MSRTQRNQARSRTKAAITAILAVAAIGYFVSAFDRAKLAALDESIERAGKLQSRGSEPAAKAILAEIVEEPNACWLARSAEAQRRDKARVALAAIFDREGEAVRATRLLEKVRDKGAVEDARKMIGRIEARKTLAIAAREAATGLWSEAERKYRENLAFDRESLPHRLTFHKMLVREGRWDEAREVYAGGIFALEKPQDVLLSLWIMDSEEPRVAEWEAEIERAEISAPDDTGVLLARAFLARSAGRFDEAFGILQRAFSKQDELAPAMRRALRLAALRLGLDSPAHFERGMNLAFPENSPQPLRIPSGEGCRAIARICAVLGLAELEKKWLERVLEFVPSDRATLARLAELARQAGKTEEAATYDRQKNEAERLRIDYTLLARKAAEPAADEALRLAEMADRLGLPFDAWAWRSIAGLMPLAQAAAPLPQTMIMEEALPQEFWERVRVPGNDAAVAAAAGRHLQFADIAERSGLAKFVHVNGSESSQLTPPLSSSGGVAVFDFDSDGHLDVYAVQSGTFPPDPAKPNDGDRLFRNKGDGTFEDVTAKAGIDRFPRGFGHGVTAGDIDGDGHLDLFVTRWRSYALYRNKGDGTFEDVTAKFGLDGERDWPTSAAFADLDGDGDLDLYVCHYLEWIEGKSYPCIDPAKPNTYDCRPSDFPALQDRLFRNDGHRFVDVSESAGIAAIDKDGRGLGVVAVDVNEDGLVDLFVANDTTPNYLLINKGDLKFEDDALASGVAANAQGGFQAGMGVAAADVDGDGLVDLAVTNFFNESTTIFVNLGGGLFADRSAVLGVAAPSRFLLGFGILLTDFDNDGVTDFMTANGHVTDGRPAIPWRMPLQVLRGTRGQAAKPAAGGKPASTEMRFVDDGPRAGEPFSRLLMARGLASGDLDGDGLLDVVVQSQNDPLIHLKNESGAGLETPANRHWIAVKLRGGRSNRDGIGAVITAKIRESGGTTVERKIWKTGGGSFQSVSAGPAHIGLGAWAKDDASAGLESIHVRWPSGTEDVIERPPIDRTIEIREGESAAKPR